MSTPAVTYSDVTFTYPGAGTPAVEGVSLAVDRGERLGILGPNGGGKSTLLKLTLGLLPLTRGKIEVMGMSPDRARRSAAIGYVPQRMAGELTMPLSGRQVVTLACSWRGNPLLPVSREVRSRVSEALELTGATGYADRAVGTLSGGQLQRVLIARALAIRPKVLILDEPTVGIDAVGQSRFAELLARLHRELGLTLLIVSHDLRAIAAGCDRVACLARTLHAHTSPDGLTPQVLADLFAHDIAGLPGVLGRTHVHAHGPDEPCPSDGGER